VRLFGELTINRLLDACDCIVADYNRCSVLEDGHLAKNIDNIVKSRMWLCIHARKDSKTYFNLFSGVQVKVHHQITKSMAMRMLKCLQEHVERVSQSGVLLVRGRLMKLCNMKAKEQGKVVRLGAKVMASYANVFPMAAFLLKIGYSHADDGQQSSADVKTGVDSDSVEKLFKKDPWEKVSTGSGHYKYKETLFDKLTMGGSAHVKELGQGAVIDQSRQIQDWVNHVADELYALPYPWLVRNSEELKYKVSAYVAKNRDVRNLARRQKEMQDAYRAAPLYATLKVLAHRN
jgi:hypothetical protein